MAFRLRPSGRSLPMRLTVSSRIRENHGLPHYHDETGIDNHYRCPRPRKAWLSPGSNSAYFGQVNTPLDRLRRRRAAIGIRREEQREECERYAGISTLVQLFKDTDRTTGLTYLAMTLTALPREFLQSTHSKHAIPCISCCNDKC